MNDKVIKLETTGMNPNSASELQKIIDKLNKEGLGYKFYPPCSEEEWGFVISFTKE